MGLSITVLTALKQALSESTPAVLVTVTRVKGSAPRGAGTSMLVLPQSLAGTIGGGRLEQVAIEKAHALVEQSTCDTVRERFPLGDSLGQCCGGSVELLFEPVQPNWQRWVNTAALALSRAETFEQPVDEHYTHRIEPHAMNLLLFGAGHVGKAVVRVLGDAPVNILWVDERSELFPQTIPSNVVCEVTDTASALIDSAPSGSAVLITTHRHDLDFELAGVAIAQPGIAYCGMIGSRSKRARFERQFRQRRGFALTPDATVTEHEGVSVDAMLARLTCPIGGRELAGKEPEIVAIAAVYEVLKTLQPSKPSKPTMLS